MGVYSMTNKLGTELGTGIIECVFEPGMEGACMIVAESEANYNAIMQAVGVAELAVYESTGEEMVYEAGDVKGFMGKVKEFFVNLWEKIKGLFRKFFSMLDSYTKSDKEFINKYKKHLLQVSTRDFKYKGFNFTIDALTVEAADTAMDGVIATAICKNGAVPNAAEATAMIKAAEDRTELLEKMRGTAVGESSLEASELTKELFMKFRSGEDSKEELDNVSVSDQIVAISENSALKKSAEKAYKELEKSIKEAIKIVDKAQSALLKEIPGKSDKDKLEERASVVKCYSNTAALLKDKMSILQLVNGAKLTAIKDKNRQAKAICTSLMNYKPKNESVSYNEGGFLSGVTIR